MPALLDGDGAELAVGRAEGLWICADDFVCTGAAAVDELGRLGFPRDFPNVYSSNKVLKSLIGKKGTCAGKMVSVVQEPSKEVLEKVGGRVLHPLQSFSNSMVVEEATGWAVVQGWIVWERLDLPAGETFVAERFWWNRMSDSTWVDLTPRPDGCPQLLLAEAAAGAAKSSGTLTEAARDMHIRLLRERFPGLAKKLVREDGGLAKRSLSSSAAVPSAPSSWAGGEGSSAGAASPASPEPLRKQLHDPFPASLRALVERVRAGDEAALEETAERLREDQELCVQLACREEDGIAEALAGMLSGAKADGALRLLLLLTDAGVERKRPHVGASVISAGAVAPLLKLLQAESTSQQETAAAILGNMCHESPENQAALAQARVFGPLVKALDADTLLAQEAAYAIWNLTVSNEENSKAAMKQGAVTKLVKLLHHFSDIAQENAAGALMHITVCEEARIAIKEANAIPRLCELLKKSHEPEVSCQAAGALLNLASDSSEFAALIIKEGAITSLVDLVRDGPDLAREYSAGALMNLMRDNIEAADAAARGGAVSALAELLTHQVGHSEALGALANLASGSPARQVEIFKCQVTRRSVKMLSDPDLERRRSAAALVMNLAPHAKVKERVIEAGALKPLAELLEDGDDLLRERAAGALANLFNDHSANVMKGFDEAPQMIPALVEIMSGGSNSEDAKRQAAHALAMMAAEDAPCERMWQAGAAEPFLALLEAGVAEAALGLMNLAWRCPEKKDELAKKGAFKHLIKMLESGDETGREYAAGALMNITASDQDSARQCATAVPTLAKLLSLQGTQAAEWAAGALANLARGEPRARQAAVAAEAAPALAAMLSRVSNGGRQLVVLALSSLAEGDQVSAVRQVLGSSEKAKLKEFRDAGDSGLRKQVKALVEKIGGGFAL